jgi:hypothetical protein
MTVLEAAQIGDEVAALEAMRDKLAAAMDEAPPTVVAQINAQLAANLKRLSELRPSGKVTIDDALAERRAARADGAKPAPSTGGKAKRAS